jgi:hypothetical protein
MEPSYEDVARQAAQRLSATFDANLPALTEGAIRGATSDRETKRFTPDVIGIASLLVTVAQLAWSIWHDLKSDQREAAKSPPPIPSHQILVRRIKLTLGERAGLPAEKRDHLIEIVAEETDRLLGGAPRP